MIQKEKQNKECASWALFLLNSLLLYHQNVTTMFGKFSEQKDSIFLVFNMLNFNIILQSMLISRNYISPLFFTRVLFLLYPYTAFFTDIIFLGFMAQTTYWMNNTILKHLVIMSIKCNSYSK